MFDSRLSNRFAYTARRIAGNLAFLIHPVGTPVKSLMFPYFWFRDRSGTIGTTETLKRLEPAVGLKRLERSAAVGQLERWNRWNYWNAISDAFHAILRCQIKKNLPWSSVNLPPVF
jgi:hypothetical protein